MTDESPDALAALQRWEESGADWALLTGPGERPVVVELLSCDGGTPMGRLTSSAPDFVAYATDDG